MAMAVRAAARQARAPSRLAPLLTTSAAALRRADLDVVTGGFANTGVAFSELLINDGSGDFTSDTESLIAGLSVATYKIVMGDLDADGGAHAGRAASARTHLSPWPRWDRP